MLTIINKGASQDKKMDKCRKAMLDELDSTQTDEEDKGQEPTVKQLSKMIKIMEGKGRRAEAPSLRRAEAHSRRAEAPVPRRREGTITMESSSSEDSSSDSSSSSEEEQTRKGEKKKSAPKKKAVKKGKQVEKEKEKEMEI